MTESRTSRERLNAGGRRSHSQLVDSLVILLLVVGFFLGPLKLLGTSWFSYLGADGLAVLVIILAFAGRIATGKPLFAASAVSMPMLLLASYCVLELANPEAPFIRSVIGLRSWILYLSFYFVGMYTLRSSAQVERLYAVLIALGILTGAYGVYQWLAGPQSFAGWSEYYGQYASLAWSVRSGGVVFRAFSTFVAAGTFGGNMAFLMLLAFSVAFSPRVRVVWRVIAAVGFIVMAVGIAASGSRGPVVILALSGAAALAFIPDIWLRLRVLLNATMLLGVAVLLVIFVIGPVVSERFSTILDPQAFFWKWFGPFTYGLDVARQHPFGMGLGYTAGIPKFISNPAFVDLPSRNVDSGYGSAAAELGFLGLGLFVYFAFRVGVEGFRTWKRLPAGRLRDLLLGPALLASTYPVVAVIAQPQATLPSSIYFWLLIGMLMKSPTLQSQVDEDQLLRTQMHA